MKHKRRKIRRRIDPFKLYGRKNRHHDKARCFGGSLNPRNIFHWDINVHRAFHFLFGNRTVLEASELLRYINEMKRQDVDIDVLGGVL